jgi:hypothetical protein
MFIVTRPKFHPGTRLAAIPARGRFASRVSAFGIAALIAGIALLTSPCRVAAQRGGGAHVAKPIICVYDCPNTEGRSALNDLKEFQRVMAMQATPEQRAAFAKITQYTQAAIDRLQVFRESLEKAPAPSALSATDLSQAVARARAGSQNFLASFSSAQKSGLKDVTTKLEKTDSELDKQIKTLDQIAQGPKPERPPENEQVVSSSAALDKALSSFQKEQLALGGEMSIVFPSAGQNLAFSLPQVTNSIDIDGQSIAIPASGAVSRASAGTPTGTPDGSSADNGRNLFSLKLVADLSDLQQNIAGVLRSSVSRSPRCGDRIEVQDASLIPLVPASLVIAHLRFEHWICGAASGRSPTELAAGDGEVEIKLTLSITPGAAMQSPGLTLASEITRVEADGFFRDALRSGDLGVNLREQVAAAILSALQKGADLKATLPPVARDLATIQKVQFEDTGADQLILVVDGQLQFSDEQTKQFAAQLNQSLSAQKTPAP